MLVFNGITANSSDFTCSRASGNSVVDYICGRSTPLTFDICADTFGALSDHSVLTCQVKFPSLVDNDFCSLESQLR